MMIGVKGGLERNKINGTTARHLYIESAFLIENPQGVCGQVWISTFLNIFLDLGSPAAINMARLS